MVEAEIVCCCDGDKGEGDPGCEASGLVAMGVEVCCKAADGDVQEFARDFVFMDLLWDMLAY